MYPRLDCKGLGVGVPEICDFNPALWVHVLHRFWLKKEVNDFFRSGWSLPRGFDDRNDRGRHNEISPAK